MWDGTSCLENIWMINSLANSMEVMILDVGMKIAYLKSQLTMIKIVSKQEKVRSFLMKSININFHSCSGIESCLRNS